MKYFVGVYSEKAAANHGSLIYLDKNGKEVEVFGVYTSLEEAKQCRWDDAEIVSECLVKYLREEKQPTTYNVRNKFQKNINYEC